MINHPKCSMYGIFTYIYPKNHPVLYVKYTSTMEHLGIIIIPIYGNPQFWSAFTAFLTKESDQKGCAWNEGFQINETFLFSVQKREQGPATKGLKKM